MSASLGNRILLIAALVSIAVLVGNGAAHFYHPGPASTSKVIAAAEVSDFKTKFEALTPPDIALPTIPTTNVPIYAKSYVVIDHATKYPIKGLNEHDKRPIASTTKIMTSLVALDVYPLDKVITVSRDAATISGSEIQLMTGETMTVENLLYSLLMNSANDAAYSFADAYTSRQAFVDLMNKKAAELGLSDTHYMDPAGLDDTGYSSAHDLAILTDYALDNPQFRKVVATQKFSAWSADKVYVHELSNSNRLIMPDEPLYYPQAIGVKTGFTFDAGHCLVGAAEYPDHSRHVVVILHTNDETSNDASAREARKLLDWTSP